MEFTQGGRLCQIGENAPKYRKASRKEKTRMLNELEEILHMHRKHIAYLLRNAGRKVYTPKGVKVIADPECSWVSKRGRKKVYTEEIIPPLVKLWRLSGYRSSKHLVAFIRLNKDVIFNHPEFSSLDEEIKNKLLKISPATVDRLLKPIRDKEEITQRYRKNPHGSYLKKKIPVESYFDKPKDMFGYVELDLVHHGGESAKGDFAYTLTFTEITTDWTELRALKNRAEVWTHKALKDILDNIPFKVRRFHSDNGTEFINYHLLRFVKERGIEFTRSRPYSKNDAPYVESRNWSMVRVYTGYRRYDTPEELAILEELMKLISLRHNYFIPTLKLVYKERRGGKVHRKYEIDTPFNRMLRSGTIDEEDKKRLIDIRKSLDFVELSRKIEELLKKLDRAYKKKYTG